MAADRHLVARAVERVSTGGFEWGRRDCLRTAEAVAVEHGYAPWLDAMGAYDEPRHARALAGAIKRHGSMGAAYRHALRVRGPYDRVLDPSRLEPGDMLVLGGVVDVPGGSYDTSGGRQILAVTGPDFGVYVWTEAGLLPVGGPTIRTRYRLQ